MMAGPMLESCLISGADAPVLEAKASLWFNSVSQSVCHTKPVKPQRGAFASPPSWIGLFAGLPFTFSFFVLLMARNFAECNKSHNKHSNQIAYASVSPFPVAHRKDCKEGG